MTSCTNLPVFLFLSSFISQDKDDNSGDVQARGNTDDKLKSLSLNAMHSQHIDKSLQI